MYYIVINDRQAGPFSREELLAQGLTPNTMVWRSGMADWMPASQVADLQPLFNTKRSRFDINKDDDRPAQVQYNNEPQYQQPQYGNNYNNYGNNNYNPRPTNWMPWAIVCTVLGLCSCIGLILGILAINNASAANNAYSMGDYQQGDTKNSTARTLTIIGLIFDAFGCLVSLGYYSTFL